MASPSPLRLIVPIALFAAVAAGAVWFLKPKAAATPSTPAAPVAEQTTPATPGAQPSTPAAPAATPSAPAASTPTASAAPEATTYTVQTHPLVTPATLGTLDDQGDSGNQMHIAFNPAGAGLERITLARHRTTIAKDAPREIVQQTERHEIVDTAGNLIAQRALVPMAALALTIDKSVINLAADLTPSNQTLWKQTAPGTFEATILQGEGASATPAVLVTRTYTLQPGGYHITLTQTAKNLTARPLNLAWVQMGPTDLPRTKTTYGGDLRRVRTGVVPSMAVNPDGQTVYGRDFIPHTTIVTQPAWNNGPVWPDMAIFPPDATKTKPEQMPQGLAWFGNAGRYFSVALHALPDRAPKRTDIPGGVTDKRLGVSTVDRVVLARGGADLSAIQNNAIAALRLSTPAIKVEPGAAADFSMGIYAGPTSRRVLQNDPVAKQVGLTDLEMYSFGGPCAFCTFQPVAYFLRWFLSLLHDNLTKDWALAIILLVVCVRTLLHPITRWSQMSLNRFGKQMQKLAPMQKAIQEKYANDPKKAREESARLMQEQGVNFAGALGCLPMFLQTPIWIALYAMIFFFFDLRHEPAFYGLFQTLSGGSWSFLADLAEPDRFIWSPTWTGFDLPLMGHVDSINVLPLLLGVVFFIQQKYLTPPSSTPLSPEMELQQKIMKVMIVILFPLMMYNAPSALAIYFITNSTLGIIESKYIRKQFDKQEAEFEEKLKRNPHLAKEKTGFMAKMQRRLLAAQQLQDARRNQQGRK